MRHLEFEVRGVDEFHFEPGQFIHVMERYSDKEIARAYSIASPPGGNRFDLCLNRAPEGFASAWLFRLKPGDEVDMVEPDGHFTLRQPKGRAIFISTGTGVAPFRSMLLDHLPRTQPEITLLFGARRESDVLYGDEFERLSQRYRSFRFLPTLSRPGPTWNGRTGRVQAHLDEVLARYRPEHLTNLNVYVCGVKEMVDDIRGRLKDHALRDEQIIYEKYEGPDQAITDSEPLPEGVAKD